MSSPRPSSPRLQPTARDQELSLQLRDLPTSAPFEGTRLRRFEFTSRGDRVPGRLALPAGAGRFPLILLQHGAGGSKESPYMDSAAPWVRGGAAVASIDFPLHGERASPKLSTRLLESFADFGSPAHAALWVGFAKQAVHDLQRALDALAEIPEIDDSRVGYASFSLGSLLGSLFCALDSRPRAAALALGGGGFGPELIDPARYIGAFAPRPLLMIAARGDERIPRRATEALYAAGGEPKSIEWFDSGHGDLPGRALKSMWSFLRVQLEIA
jgi:dienelactone hydrolase